MSWVPLVTAEEASPEVKKTYEFLQENWGFVPNYFLMLGGNKNLLQDQVNFFTDAMVVEREGGLPRVVKEQLAMVVSGLNIASYCLATHMEILGQLGIEKPMARKLALDYASAKVEPKVMEVFRFAEKLTKRPSEMEKADVQRLRDAGWGDTAIIDAALVISAYALANRFSAGLGLIADF